MNYPDFVVQHNQPKTTIVPTSTEQATQMAQKPNLTKEPTTKNKDNMTPLCTKRLRATMVRRTYPTIDPTAEMGQIKRMPVKTVPSQATPARALTLANIYKGRKDRPVDFVSSLEFVEVKSLEFTGTDDEGHVVFERLPRDVRITTTTLSILSEDKGTGGMSRRPYAMTDFPTTNRTEATLPRLLPKERVDSLSFHIKMMRMARNPAQARINPERGNLVEMQKRQESRKAKKDARYGGQLLNFQRIILKGELEDKCAKECKMCTLMASPCKSCKDQWVRLKGLIERQEELWVHVAPVRIQAEDVEESEESSESSESSSDSSVSSSEDDEDWDDYVVVDVELTPEQQRQRRQNALRKAAERERMGLQREARKREEEAIKQRTRYMQMLVRGAAGQCRVAYSMGLVRWW